MKENCRGVSISWSSPLLEERKRKMEKFKREIMNDEAALVAKRRRLASLKDKVFYHNTCNHSFTQFDIEWENAAFRQMR